MDEWNAAVAGGDAAKLSDLVLSSAGSSTEAALSILQSCVTILQKKQAAETTGTTPTANGGPTEGKPKSDSNGGAPSSSPLITLENVQLLQPRGRFDLVFRKGGVTIAGKAGDVAVSWDNLRHIIRLPRPEGFNWGKVLDPDDPAGSDLIALPLKEPVPFRKSKTPLVLLQPDPKAKHSEVSISVDGASHQVSGSQGTLVMSALKLLSRVRQVAPDRGLFASRDGKSFVKCYHGVNEGSLFPLKQGLLFMKPALFLPRTDIQEVVCGRGGSATTRYVDLVVGLEVDDEDNGEPVAKQQQQQEFSNIDRDALPSLQSYIQDALVAPRQREAKREAKAAAAAEQQQKAAPSTVATAATTSSPATASTPEGRGSAECTAKVPQEEEEEEDEEEEDDGDDESDEDFAPRGGDAGSNDDSDSDSDSDSSSDSDDEDNDNDGGVGGGDSESDDDGGAAARAEALRELDELAIEAAGGGGSGSGGGSGGSGGGSGGSADGGDGSSGKRKKRSVVEGRNDDDEDTESDGDRGGRPRKMQR